MFQVFLFGFFFLPTSLNAFTLGTLIPLYIYPTTTDSNGNNVWDTFIGMHEGNPVNLWAVVNVNNGPGSGIDSNYVAGLAKLKAAGIKIIGYVSTDYAKRSESAVRIDVDRWKVLYSGIDGIFLDEMTNVNGPNNENLYYYRNLYSYIKNDHGFERVVANPGTDPTLELRNAVDTVVNFEKLGYPTEADFSKWEVDGHENSKDKFSLMVYAANLDWGLVEKCKKYFGYIYVTNDAFPNPWDTIPFYLEDLFYQLRN